MLDWLRMKWAHLQDAAAIWDGSYLPCPGKQKFSWLKVKATICIALDREDRRGIFADEMVPVWASNPTTYWSYDGPGQQWAEVAVSLTGWRFSRYTNGF